MQIIKRVFFKFLVIFLVLLFIFLTSYYVTYLRYDDKEIIEKEILILQNQNLKDENQKLQEAVDLKTHHEGYVMARVILRNIHEFYNEIVIDKGSDEIKVGNAVLNAEGLIGLVSKVEKDKSYVRLLTGNYNVSVIVNGSFGNLNNGCVTLNDKYVEINEGDKVYTSGLTNVAKNIYVGDVLDVKYDENGLIQKAKINLINNNVLNYVAILVGD